MSATSKMNDAAKEIGKRVGQAASTAKTKAGEVAHDIQEQTAIAAGKAKEAVQKGATTAADIVKKKI